MNTGNKLSLVEAHGFLVKFGAFFARFKPSNLQVLSGLHESFRPFWQSIAFVCCLTSLIRFLGDDLSGFVLHQFTLISEKWLCRLYSIIWFSRIVFPKTIKITFFCPVVLTFVRVPLQTWARVPRMETRRALRLRRTTLFLRVVRRLRETRRVVLRLVRRRVVRRAERRAAIFDFLKKWKKGDDKSESETDYEKGLCVRFADFILKRKNRISFDKTSFNMGDMPGKEKLINWEM